jgi:peptidoglycan/xylan/chitin deacetylase (PgdA/CDA1 family)
MVLVLPDGAPMSVGIVFQDPSGSCASNVGKGNERFASREALAAEIVRRGHRVENHSQSHSHLFACYPSPALRREIERAQEAIERASGRRPGLFRAPAGLRNPFLDEVLHRAGLRLVSWTRRGFDAVSRDAAAIAARLLRGLVPSDILLLHDGSTLGERGGNRRVLEVLPRVLEALAARGLHSVPIEVD